MITRLMCKVFGHKWVTFAKYTIAFDPPEQWWRCDRCKEETDQPEG